MSVGTAIQASDGIVAQVDVVTLEAADAEGPHDAAVAAVPGGRRVHKSFVLYSLGCVIRFMVPNNIVVLDS